MSDPVEPTGAGDASPQAPPPLAAPPVAPPVEPTFPVPAPSSAGPSSAPPLLEPARQPATGPAPAAPAAPTPVTREPAPPAPAQQPPVADAPTARPTRAEAKASEVVETLQASASRAALVRRIVKVAAILLVAVLWVRVVLFEYAFPAVERRIDNPELLPDEDETGAFSGLGLPGDLPALAAPSWQPVPAR